jgi:transcriptional regulator with XRE-family HTH domain
VSFVSEDSLGRQLRSERERRRITLQSIAANTKISVSLLQGLERDDVSRWPSGIFRRSFVRLYAEAVGLDADETLAEFLSRFPDPEGTALAAPAVSDPFSRKRADKALRLTLDDASWTPFVGGTVLASIRDRCSAAALDMGLMIALALIIFLIVGDFWAPLGITMLCYYVVSILSLGNTPGVCLFAPRPHHHSGGEAGGPEGEPAGTFDYDHP